MKRILWGAVALVAVVAAAMAVLVALYGGRLKEEALREVNARLEAEVSIETIRVGALRNFPDLTLSLRGVAIDGRGAFEGVRLLDAGAADFRVDLWNLLRGDMVVEGIAVNGGHVRLVGDAEGRWNADIVREEETAGVEGEGDAGAAEEAGLAFRVESISIRGMRLSVEDRAAAWWADLREMEADGALSLEGEAMRLPMQVRVGRLASGEGLEVPAGPDGAGAELGEAVAVGEAMEAAFTLVAPGPVEGLPAWVEGQLRAPDLRLSHGGFEEPVVVALEALRADPDGMVRVEGATMAAAGGRWRLDGEVPRVAEMVAEMLAEDGEPGSGGELGGEELELQGRFRLRGSGIDVNRWLGAAGMTEEEMEEEQEEEAQWTGPIRIPEGVDVQIEVAVEDAVYGEVSLRNLEGTVALADRRASLRGVGMEAMGGRVAMEGTYDSRPETPRVRTTLELQEIGFRESYRAMRMVRILAPLMERAEGSYSASLEFDSALRPDLMPELGTVEAVGTIRSEGFSGSLPALRELARLANRPELDTLRTSPVRLSFQIREGWMRVPPFEVEAAGVGLEVSGRGGLDRTLDFEMVAEVPLSGDSRVGAAVERLLSRVTKAPGALRIRAHVGGRVGEPEVSLKGVETVR